MKIVILNYEFPPLGGGAGNANENIAKNLVTLGHEVTVVTTWFTGLQNEQIVDGYRLIRLHSLRKRKDRSNTLEMFHYVFLATLYCLKNFKIDRPDCIISFFALPTGLAAWILSKYFKVPYILSLRGGDVPGFLPKNLKMLHMLTMPLTLLIWGSAKSIVANSIGLQELAQKTGDKVGKRVLCIPNGVNTDLFKPSSNSGKVGLGLKILFVGRLTEQKGATFLLKALSQIRIKNAEIYDQINCQIIGDGPLMNDLKNEVSHLGITSRVEFSGWIDRNQLPEIYRLSSVFVLPTYEEGMPNVVLEAMASGLPVIATDVPGNNELIRNRENGLLVKDVKDLADALIEILNNPNLAKKLSDGARETMLKRGWSQIAEQYAKLCQ